MSIFAFLAVIVIAYFAIRIGAAAFELTGLDSDQSMFQAISAFTGTGFTTRESELIMAHRQRRKIASVLMVLGTAGFATFIATLVSSLTSNAESISLIPWLAKAVPHAFLSYINLVIIIIILFLIYRIFHSSRFSKFLISKVQQRMLDSKIIQKVYFEELLLSAEGYGIVQFEIISKSLFLNKTLLESGLKEKDIIVLSIQRGLEHIANPSPNIRFNLHDKLICFGKLDNIRMLAGETVL